MIRAAEILHYKSLHEARLNFKNVNIIVGPNGSGKSNILDALYFLHDCAVEDIDTAVTKRHGIDSIRQWSPTRPYHITLHTQLSNGPEFGYYKLVLSSNKGEYRIVEEEGGWHSSITFTPDEDDPDGEEEVRSGWIRFRRSPDHEIHMISEISGIDLDRPVTIGHDQLFLTIMNRGAGWGSFILRQIAEEFRSFSKYTIYPNTLRNPQLLSRDLTLSEDGSNLATILKRVNSDKRYSNNKDSILSGLQYLMPIAKDFIVKSAGGYYVPVLKVQEQDKTHEFNLSQISDGTLRALGLLAAFYQPNAPNKIGVEEPEQMIHPGALPILRDAIDDFVRNGPARNRQVFITTHSPPLLDLVSPEFITWARFENGVTWCGDIGPRQLDLIKEQLFSAGEILVTEGFH